MHIQLVTSDVISLTTGGHDDTCPWTRILRSAQAIQMYYDQLIMTGQVPETNYNSPRYLRIAASQSASR
jgi:hypothetical protein